MAPLPGVTVSAKGTSIGTITDVNGTYQISVPENSELLVFSFVGLLTREISSAGQSDIAVLMEQDLLQIDEVVVTAMGIRKEKKALGYSVQEINESEISEAKNMDISKSLQGKIAGVNVKQSSGMPGATAHVTIRGNVSLTGSNQPLYVVDGMPIASEKVFTENEGEGTNPSSRILDLNPEDIETISVLKGATASALYGLRAANGVIVITTKSGSAAKLAGKRTLVTVNSSFTSDRVSRLPDLQSTYGQGNGGTLGLWSSGSWGPRIDTLQNYQSQEENLYFVILMRPLTDLLQPKFLKYITTRRISLRRATLLQIQWIFHLPATGRITVSDWEGLIRKALLKPQEWSGTMPNSTGISSWVINGQLLYQRTFPQWILIRYPEEATWPIPYLRSILHPAPMI